MEDSLLYSHHAMVEVVFIASVREIYLYIRSLALQAENSKLSGHIITAFQDSNVIFIIGCSLDAVVAGQEVLFYVKFPFFHP